MFRGIEDFRRCEAQRENHQLRTPMSPLLKTNGIIKYLGSNSFILLEAVKPLSELSMVGWVVAAKQPSGTKTPQT
jgi:hypothetical protein